MFKDLQANPLSYCTVQLLNDDINTWRVTMNGPLESPYAGGTFIIDIIVPEAYPKVIPEVKQRTKIFHMNFNKQGKICLDLLYTHWNHKKPHTMKAILEDIYSHLKNPNPQSAIYGRAWQTWFDGENLYNNEAKNWTKQFASNNINNNIFWSQNQNENDNNKDNDQKNNDKTITTDSIQTVKQTTTTLVMFLYVFQMFS